MDNFLKMHKKYSFWSIELKAKALHKFQTVTSRNEEVFCI